MKKTGNLTSWRTFCALVVLALAGLLTSSFAVAATATASPANCQSTAGIGTVAWSNAGNATDSDNSRATASVDGSTTNWLVCTNYGFAIPAGSTINGIVVNVERRSSSTNNGGSEDVAVRAVKAGVIGATDRATGTNYTTSDVVEAHGGAADLWGTTWTTAQVNAADFGAAFAASKPSSSGGAHTISVDHIQIVIDYTPPPAVSSINRASTDPTAGAASVSWTVVFDQSVSGVDSTDFSLVQAGGVAGAAISAVSGSGTTWTVTASTGTGSGTLGLNLVDNDSIVAGAVPLGGTGAGNGNFTGQVYTVSVPAVVSINRASPNPTTASAAVSWTVTFSAAMTGVDLTDFALVQAGGAAGATLTSVSGSGTTWTVLANAGTSSSGTLGLNLVDDDTIVNANTVPLGGAGLANGNFTGQTYSLIPPYPTLTKTSSTSAAVINDVITFTITAANSFAVDQSNVVLTDTLPAGMTYQVHLVSQGTVTVFGNVVTWTIPLIPAGGSAQMTLAVELTTQGSLTNSVSAPGATTATASVLVLASAVTHFRLDEPVGSWTGAAGEVVDSGGTGLHGRRLTTSVPTTTNTIIPDPAIATSHPSVIGSFCNAGNFDGNAVVQVGDSPAFDYTTQLSASAWIYPTAYPGSDLSSILSNDTNYEFHLDTTGRLYWWWNYSTLTSNATIPRDKWTHIAITLSSAAGAGRQRIYINGVADPNTNNWTGTLQANNCNFYIGGDIATGAACSLIPGRNFRGRIDEVKLYAYELSAAEVQADMTLGRLCSGTFDHLRIEHDAVASVCAPETVTVKACLDSSCSTLYTGNVTVTLSPTGWVGGDTFTFSGGIGSRQLSRSTAGNTTLDTVSVTPAPGGGTRCFNGGSETCTMNFASASCVFDVAETGGAPQSRLYTKLANTDFSLDLLALLSPSTINTSYTGPVSVDLVDASSSACPSGGGLTTATSVTFVADDNGRKLVSFTYPNAAKNVKVRAVVGASTPACSNDNFAIRPQQFSVTSSMNNTALTGTPAATAGSAFSLTAAAGVASGYDGTPALDATKVNDHDGVAIASGTLSGVFGAGTGAAASGATFKYLDVGSIQLAANAVVDSGFTSVDQSTDCVVGSTSNTLSGGKYGCNVGSVASAKFGRWYPSHYSFSGTLTPGCVAGTYTYMGEDALGVALTVKAHAVGAGAASASDPVTSRYTYNAAPNSLVVAPVTLAGDNSGTAISVTRLSSPAFPVMPNNGLWSAGLFPINDSYAFSRLAAPDGPYDVFKLTAAVNDADGAALIAPVETNTTRLRFGRLRINNAYGSELLPLPLPVEAQYWSGSFFTTHAADSCTSIDPATIVMSGYTQGLAACETFFQPSAAFTLTNGKGALTLRAPGSGNAGSVTLGLNVGAAVPGSKTCLSASETNAAAGNLPGFGSVNPTARATFGAFKTPLIYRRENY
ncbi:MAG: DUF6701 domain-containing protein [Rhodocyclaceae bacterium]